MNVYLSKAFTRLAVHEGLTNAHICRAVAEMDNIEEDELKALKRLAKYYLAMKPGEIETALQCGELTEVNCDEKKK